VSARHASNAPTYPPLSVIFPVTPGMILPRQWQAGARIDPDLQSGAMRFVLAIAAYTLKVGPIVLATAFGYRGVMVHLCRERQPSTDQTALAARLIGELMGAQLAPASITTLRPAVTQWSIQGGRLPGHYQCTVASIRSTHAMHASFRLMSSSCSLMSASFARIRATCA
jgi:hypothetical protein